MPNSTPSHPGRPQPDEYNPYYSQYISLVPEGEILDLLEGQLDDTRACLIPLTPDQIAVRPKPEDWNIAQVVGHIADCERVFAYRALCFARKDATPLPGFDQDLFVANTNFAQRPFIDLLDDFAAVRHATLTLLRSLDGEGWLHRGTANNNPVSVRALAYIIAGHELHHVDDLRRRYNIG